ncbi:hypothetical protein EV687_0911 [Corticibacter populi]|nr:hypothetical protein EV687_0911 [Corticibacter populi]
MKKILFTYDLNKDSPSDKWGRVREAIIRKFPTHWCRLTTTWIVETQLSAVQMRDWLATLLDSNDELFVVDITGSDAAWLGIDAKGATWLREVLNR